METDYTPPQPEEKGITVNAGNIHAIIEQFKKITKATPAERFRQCSGCEQIMANQPASLVFVDGVPNFYCELCNEYKPWTR